MGNRNKNIGKKQQKKAVKPTAEQKIEQFEKQRKKKSMKWNLICAAICGVAALIYAIGENVGMAAIYVGLCAVFFCLFVTNYRKSQG